MRRKKLAEDQVQTKKMRKMNNEAPDEISAGTFVCMKEDVTTISDEGVDDEDAEGRNGKWQ